MVAVWQSVSAAGATLGTDPVVALPAGTVDGDLLVAVGLVNGANTITAPAGWTTHPNSLGTSNPLWTRVASSEPADYTFVTSGTASSIVQIVRISGYNTATPIDVATGVAGTGTAYVIPTLTSNGADRLLMQMVSKLNNTSFTGPGSQTERYDAVTTGFTYAGGDEVVGSGATGTRTWTAASGSNFGVAYMLAVAPIPPEEGTFAGAYDFSGSGFTGQAGPAGGTFTGDYDFSGSGFVGEAPGVSSGAFTGDYDFSGSFTGVAPPPTPGGNNRWTPGGRDRFTARRTPKNRRRSR